VIDDLTFALPEALEDRDWVIASYLQRLPAGADPHHAARALAALQSTGTWVELGTETPQIRDRHGARVIGMWQVPDHETGATSGADAGESTWILQLAYPTHNIGNQIPLLLSTVYGECASSGTVKLLDLQLPRSFVDAFRGPQLGIEGIRDRLGVHDRPLLLAMMKPALGLTPTESARVVREAALGGVDLIKDDELLVSHPWSSFEDRVRAHEEAIRQVHEQTGQRMISFVNITDRPDRMVANAHRALDAGASGLMVDYLTVGISSLSMLAEDPAIEVPILGHLAFAGAMYASPWSGVSSHLVLGKLPRLAGADLIVYPSPYGSLSYARSKHLRLALAMTGRLFGLRRTTPAPGGGLHARMVPALMADLGIDFALGVGGAIHAHPLGATAGARALRQAIDATLCGQALDDAGAEHPELGAALETWQELR
jgi:2,3-diketo-5-methylthiopentyl-1-phosphate enolase